MHATVRRAFPQLQIFWRATKALSRKSCVIGASSSIPPSFSSHWTFNNVKIEWLIISSRSIAFAFFFFFSILISFSFQIFHNELCCMCSSDLGMLCAVLPSLWTAAADRRRILGGHLLLPSRGTGHQGRPEPAAGHQDAQADRRGGGGSVRGVQQRRATYAAELCPLLRSPRPHPRRLQVSS